jgi:hypothetical protein
MPYRVCKVKNCKKAVIAKSYCNQHYLMFRKLGNPLAGKYRTPFKKALDHGDGTTTCTVCKKRLPLTEFHKDKTATGGLRAKCKKCRIKVVTNWYDKNRESQSNKKKMHRQANIEKYRQKEAERYEKDREKRIALASEHSQLRRSRKKKTKVERGISKLSLKRNLGQNDITVGKKWILA